ncbi:hypothetical protein B1R94_22140 [Mycolicibacterium litorale]|nr:hypothetical protein B1R94_22140 [Mycolicibacterium litorale]
MTTMTLHTPVSTEAGEWLDAIAQHPDIKPEHLLAAYAGLGVETDLTDDQIHDGEFWLLLLGFLRTTAISEDERTWTFERRIPVVR